MRPSPTTPAARRDSSNRLGMGVGGGATPGRDTPGRPAWLRVGQQNGSGRLEEKPRSGSSTADVVCPRTPPSPSPLLLPLPAHNSNSSSSGGSSRSTSRSSTSSSSSSNSSRIISTSSTSSSCRGSGSGRGRGEMLPSSFYLLPPSPLQLPGPAPLSSVNGTLSNGSTPRTPPGQTHRGQRFGALAGTASTVTAATPTPLIVSAQPPPQLLCKEVPPSATPSQPGACHGAQGLWPGCSSPHSLAWPQPISLDRSPPGRPGRPPRLILFSAARTMPQERTPGVTLSTATRPSATAVGPSNRLGESGRQPLHRGAFLVQPSAGPRREAYTLAHTPLTHPGGMAEPVRDSPALPLRSCGAGLRDD